MLTVSTSLGDFTVELFEKEAPISVANFLEYVDENYYKGTIFHRVIPNFMIQGGGFNHTMMQKGTKAPIKNEADNGLKNERGTLAMARTPAVNSATSQFFVNLNDNAFLDHGEKDFGYAVFGKVVSGMDVVDEIAKVDTGTNGQHQDVPKKAVTIKSISQVES